MAAPIFEIPEQFNMASVLIDSTVKQGQGSRTAIIYEDKYISYDEAYSMLNKTGNTLAGLGILREQRILLLLPDCPEFIYSFIGAMKIGAVPVPLNTLLKPNDYLYYLNDSRAEALVVGTEYLPLVEEILPQAEYVKHIIVVGHHDHKHIKYDELVEGASPVLEPVKTSRDDACFWLYSSGTTGSPKGTIHLHHDMVFAANYYDRSVSNITSNDTIFSVSKLFFSYGNVNSCFLPFQCGASVVLDPLRPDPLRAMALIEKHRPTCFYGVPTFYMSMLRATSEGQSCDFSSVRLFMSAGENLPSSIWQQWKDKTGAEILDGIGSTEVGHMYIANRPGEVKPGSSGKLNLGYEAKIVDEYDQELPLGQVGNLKIKSDGIAAGYWNKHHKTLDAFKGRWYYTGDQFSLDEEGYYWYSGRSDDMVKVGGIWVSPIEVENVVLEHPAVLECAVVGTMDQDGLIKLAAYVVLAPGNEGGDEMTAKIKEFVKSKIATFKSPRWIYYLEELPKTASGKTQRFKLRQLAGRLSG